ncbi:MAG TPA: hypothetical protein VM487_12595, partial [Phycisphaerae bacterium]|nr:hypothetical protein [Phycisphaerae bacterium]
MIVQVDRDVVILLRQLDRPHDGCVDALAGLAGWLVRLHLHRHGMHERHPLRAFGEYGAPGEAGSIRAARRLHRLGLDNQVSVGARDAFGEDGQDDGPALASLQGNVQAARDPDLRAAVIHRHADRRRLLLRRSVFDVDRHFQLIAAPAGEVVGQRHLHEHGKRRLAVGQAVDQPLEQRIPRGGVVGAFGLVGIVVGAGAPLPLPAVGLVDVDDLPAALGQLAVPELRLVLLVERERLAGVVDRCVHRPVPVGTGHFQGQAACQRMIAGAQAAGGPRLAPAVEFHRQHVGQRRA